MNKNHRDVFSGNKVCFPIVCSKYYGHASVSERKVEVELQ